MDYNSRRASYRLLDWAAVALDLKEDWDFYEMVDHFVLEMNAGNLIIWATRLENFWTVDFVDAPTDRPAFREITRRIQVTDGRLYLTSYDDLSMAAKFKDQRLPSKHNADSFIALPNDVYDITVRQIGDPTDLGVDIDDLSFEIVVRPADTRTAQAEIEAILWYEAV